MDNYHSPCHNCFRKVIVPIEVCVGMCYPILVNKNNTY